MPDIVIIGGGIAGLSAAWECVARGRQPLVLEAAPRAGGVILTERAGGFTIDAGPDALLIQKPAAITLCKELGLGDRLFPTLEPRGAFVIRNRRLVPLPEASFLGIPVKIGPFVTTRLFSWPGKLRMGLELVIPARPQEDESIGSFMRRRFGQETVSYLAEPLLAGIHAGDVDRLSMRALFPRLLEAERSHGSVVRALRSLRIPPSKDGAFMSLPGGIGEMLDTLVAKLPDGVIRTGSAVQRLERGPDGWRVHTAAGDTVDARAVLVAVPAYAAAPLLDPIDADAAALCRSTRYVSSATVALGYRRAQVRHPLAGSGFVVPTAERRTLMAGSWVSSKWPMRAPDGHVLLRGFVGGAYDEAILDRSDADIGAACAAEFADLLGIDGPPVLTRVYRWVRASAQHEVGHHARLAALEARLRALPGLHVSGSGFRGTGVADCVADGRAVAGSIVSTLAGT
jgi:oxygen-dependent protoporphyrinogen oxidase